MPLPPSSKYVQRPHDPVDETERESITARLNSAFSDGRISHDEYAASMETLYQATVLADLVPVVERLPAPAADVPAIVTHSSGLPAGRLSEGRSVQPMALVVAAVGIVLVAILVILLAMLVF